MLTSDQLARLRRTRARGRNRLSHAMELHGGLTQVELAAAVDLTQVHISSLARGAYKDLPVETARKLAEYFGCAIEDLFPAREAAS